MTGKEVTISNRMDIDGNQRFFWMDEVPVGVIPKNHPLHGSIPPETSFKARLTVRGKSVWATILLREHASSMLNA